MPLKVISKNALEFYEKPFQTVWEFVVNFRHFLLVFGFVFSVCSIGKLLIGTNSDLTLIFIRMGSKYKPQHTILDDFLIFIVLIFKQYLTVVH